MSQVPPPDAYPEDLEPAPRSGRSTSFYIAIFLGLLLLLSAGLNLLLLVVSVVGTATSGLAGIDGDDPTMYEVRSVGGDAEAQDRLLLVRVDGAIAEAASPVLGAEGGTVSQVKRSLRLAARNEAIRGVLLDINSPGGGVTDSDLIYREIRDFRDETGKKVVALFGDLAASGGYYIAAAADSIYARRTSMTGSIGVIMSNLNFAGAAEKFGIRQEIILSERTPYKDILSPFRPMRDDERAIMTSIVDDMYDRFVEVVDAGRPLLDREQVITLADGRVYSALQAVDNGLVDGIRTRDEAFDELRRLCGLESAQWVEQRRRPTFIDLLTGAAARAAGPSDGLEQLLGRATGPRLLYWWSGAR
jgi:protease-4